MTAGAGGGSLPTFDDFFTMAEIAVVRRYARALFETAVKSQTVDQVEEDLKAVDGVIRQLPQLQRAFRAPTVSETQKKALLRRGFESRVGPLTLRFLELVVERRREDVLKDIYGEFLQLANAARNILPVEVSAATPLTDPERDALARSLAARTGKTIDLRVRIEPELMGGMIVRMGDTILDGSVRTRLNQLKQRLLAGRLG
jgi:F-type H+-transporting ATPase subunit delta